MDFVASAKNLQTKFIVGNCIPIDAPVQEEGWITVTVDSSRHRKECDFIPYDTQTSIYKRTMFRNNWKTNWAKLNNFSADIELSSNGFTEYPADFLNNTMFNIRMVETTGNYQNAPSIINGAWYNVLTLGVANRCNQFAFCGYIGYDTSQKIYMRTQHDATVTGWREI